VTQQQQTKQETDRGAQVIKLAIKIMAQGHHGWS
jgi:hypothetical protein